MTHFANSITEINASGFVIIMLILIVVTVGVIRFIISHKKLKFNLSSTFLIVSMLSLGLFLTPPGEAKVKESQSEKESRTKTGSKPTTGSKSTGSKSTGSQSTDSKSTDSSKQKK